MFEEQQEVMAELNKERQRKNEMTSRASSQTSSQAIGEGQSLKNYFSLK